MPAVNSALSGFARMHNYHAVRTEGHRTPRQIWISGRSDRLLKEADRLAAKDLAHYGRYQSSSSSSSSLSASDSELGRGGGGGVGGVGGGGGGGDGGDDHEGVPVRPLRYAVPSSIQELVAPYALDSAPASDNQWGVSAFQRVLRILEQNRALLDHLPD
jgi:hypothetical protein